MKPSTRYLNKRKSFWAAVRSISQSVGYSKKGKIIVPSQNDLEKAFRKMGMDVKHLSHQEGPTDFAQELLGYFAERARVLVDEVEPKLMTADEARELFFETKNRLNPQCPIPMNKQKGEKKAEAFLTGLVNMMIEAHCAGIPCDHDPRELTSVRAYGMPLRTLSRRVDGAFPSVINPIAVWEIKEYYYTTTFGSRVADGVYETLLDGMELEEMRESEDIDVKHYLMADAHFTWWKCGKSYLCRMFDMVHMGYVDEILFGREVVEEMPRIVSEWVEAYRNRSA